VILTPLQQKTGTCKNVLNQKKNSTGWQMMQKSLSVKKKKRILNDLIMKLDKPSSIGRTSASVRPRSLRTHENTEVVSFAEQVDQPVDEKIYWSFC